MSKAVRFDDYGGVEGLDVRDVPRPQPGPDQVLAPHRAAASKMSAEQLRTPAVLVRAIFRENSPTGQAQTSPAWSRRSAQA